MIFLYSGTPGSGKSLHLASEMVGFLKKGRPIIGNFDINRNYLKNGCSSFIYKTNDEITPDYLKDFSRRYFRENKFSEGRILLVLDEAQLLFNAREWSKAGRSDWLSFFTQHRKYGYNIILVAQFDRMLDRQIRSLIEYEKIHRKVIHYGTFGFLVSLLFGGKLFFYREVWYPVKEKTGGSFRVYNKKLFDFYDSYLDFSAGSEGVSVLSSDNKETPKKGKGPTYKERIKKILKQLLGKIGG